MKTIYLDHAATTYLDPAVKAAMEPYWETDYGNPSSVYSLGRSAAKAVKKARQDIASILNAASSEIIFTAGGTESINLALFGLMQSAGVAAGSHIITTTFEHSAVLKSCARLEQIGFQVTRVNVTSDGVVDLDELKQAVRPNTRLISVMYANNEIGTVQPIAAIGSWLKVYNEQRLMQQVPEIFFHTDACQAGGALPLDVKALGLDLMTLNGSKVYGPKQTGLLYARQGIELEPLLYGGGQECNKRSGTENVPGIVGLATALVLAQKHQAEEEPRLRSLRQDFLNTIMAAVPDTRLNGAIEQTITQTPLQRLPNNLHLSFSGVDGPALMLLLDQSGICVSTGSACMSNDGHSAISHVLQAIQCPSDYARGSLRITLGRRTTQADLDVTAEKLIAAVKQLRKS